MRNLFIIFFLFTALSLKAQNACEFDIVYNNQYGNEKGFKAIKVNNDEIFLASIRGYFTYGGFKDSLVFNLSKTNSCGSLIWSKIVFVEKTKFSELPNESIIDLIDNKGNLLYALSYFSNGKNPAKSGIHLLNIDYNGFVLSEKSIIDTINVYNLNSLNIVSGNNYLMAGSKNNKAYFLICDTLLNIKNHKTFSIDSTQNGTIQKVGLMPNNTIILLGIEGNIPFIKTIDSAGNLINNVIINTSVNYTNNSINFNYNKSAIIINGKIGLNYDSACINYYDLNGQLIKQILSSNYNRLNKYGLFESYKPNINMHYSNGNWIKLDSNFNIITKDSIPGYCIGSTGYCNYFSANTLTEISENEIVGIGYKLEGGPTSRTYSLQVKKINIENLVANITISGPSTINTKSGNILLTANILPASANNKQVTWNINDTNLATITQTGLLTAKANGTVIVTATAADGGGAKATKTVTISNQNTFVQQISFIGNDSIFTKNGSLQLNTQILPSNATNKQIIWNINDTSLATITQMGLVTAKANGTVMVTATAADGGGAKATKNITISNQNVGINEVNLSNQITVYPNPVSNVLTIKSAVDLSGLQLQLLDITGKVIAKYHNQTEIDLTNIANGIYMLNIQTNHGNVVKQVVINK